MYEITTKVDKMDRKQMISILIIIYIINVILRTFFAFKTKTATVMPDELIYLDIAESLWYTGKMTVHNQPLHLQQFLYGVVISPIMGVKDLQIRYEVLSLFNSIMITSSIFPTYCIAKKMINRNSISILCCIFTMLLPDMAMSMSFMAENLFFPLCLWTIYVLVCFYYEEYKKKKYIIILAILCAICYYTKMVALYIVVGFIIGAIFEIFLLKEGNIKQKLFYIFLYLAIFFILKWGIQEIVYYDILGGINTTSISLTNIDSGYKFIYFIYAGIYITMCTIIAFFYFPVLYPIFNFKTLEFHDKKVFLNMVTMVLVAVGVVCYMISIKEDYGYLVPHVHLRYYSPFLVPLLILYIKLIFSNEKRNKYLNKKVIIGATIFLCMLIVSIFSFNRYNIVDGVLLQFFREIGNRKVRYFNYEAGRLSFSMVEFIVKIFIIIIIIYNSLLLYFKKQKSFKCSTIILIIFMCILNNICSIKSIDGLYNQFYNEESIKEIKNIREYLDDKEGNILVITNNYFGYFDRMIETYFYHNAYYTYKDSILGKISEDNYVNLKEERLDSNYPVGIYSQLNEVNYVLTDNSVILLPENAEQIEMESSERYSLYAIKNPNYLMINDKSFFPDTINTNRKLWTNQEGSLYTQHDIDKNGFFVSNSSSNKALCYGPYKKLTSGSYEITFYYDDMTKKDAGERLGRVELITNDENINSLISTAYFYAKEDYVTLPISILEKDSNSVEIRMWTDIKGIRLKYIEIKKIK